MRAGLRKGWRRRALEAGGVALAIGSASASVHADPVPPRLSDGVTVPSQNAASLLSSTSTLINPANLAFLPGGELRATLVHTGNAAELPLRGVALGGAVPFWILATGLHLDWMNPPSSASEAFASVPGALRFGWVRWGNAIRLGDWGAFGTTLAWSHSGSPAADGLFSVSSGLTLRPFSILGASVVARDWNAPVNAAGTTVDPSLDLALALRPIGGHRRLEIGGLASYVHELHRWSAGATLAADIPYVGTFRAGARFVDFDRPALVANAGIELNFDAAQLAGGVVFGNALSRAGTGGYASAAWRGFTEKPRLPRSERIVRIRIDATPGARQHVRFVRRLLALADDSEVAGVLLVPREDLASSHAHAEELVDAVRVLRSRGKKVLCHLQDATGRQLRVCAQADRTAMNPAGGLRFAGLSSTSFFVGGLLERIGVRADFVRIGTFKSAPEQFARGPSDAARAVQQDLLEAYDRAFLADLAAGRGVSPEAMRTRIANGPMIASEARDAGLIDALAYEDETERFVEESLGRRIRIVDGSIPDEVPSWWRTPSRVAIVYLQGDMVDGESRDIPLVGLKLAGSVTVARALKQAREDRSVKAVVFRIETGGGSSLAADVMWREAALTAKAKPLVVSMGSRAASGGYYASVAGREIFANPSTLTGSIGVFYGKVDVGGLLDKLGISVTTLRTAPRADADSLFRPFSDDEHEVLGRKVKQFYDLFVARVAEGRRMTPEAVHAVAEGHVWTGTQAVERGLADRIGGVRQALERARELAGLPDDAPVVELPEIKTTLVDRALQAAGVPKLQTTDAPWLSGAVRSLAETLVPLVAFGADRPLARLEWMVTEP